MSMVEILNTIVASRKDRIHAERKSVPFSDIKEKAEKKIKDGYTPVDFLAWYSEKEPFLIAEIKKASPSKGLLRKDFNVDSISRAYHGSPFVRAISVLTEPDFFSGTYENISAAVSVPGDAGGRRLPVLMKDFIIDQYQVYRGFLEGASAVLLIASLLSDADIAVLRSAADVLRMHVLFEVHSSDEYRRANELGFRLIGINNRDLDTFQVDVRATARILESCGKKEGTVVISESGIHSTEDLRFLLGAGADGFLIGEYFMKSANIADAIRSLCGDL